MIKFEIKDDSGYLIETFSGLFSLEEFQEYELQLQSQPGYHSALARIYDFRESTNVAITTAQLVKMVQQSRHWAIDDDAKIALIAANNNDAGTLRLFASHFKAQPIRVFMDMTSAIKWMDVLEWSLDIVDQNAKYKTISFRGTVRMDDIIRKQNEWYADPDFNPLTPILWDLRDVKPEVSITELEQKTPFIIGRSSSNNRSGKTAILVNSRLMDMLLRKMMENPDWRDESRLFSSVQDAVEWVSG